MFRPHWPAWPHRSEGLETVAKFLITGASGSIGGRLAEVLHGSGKHEILAVVGRAGSAGRARLGRMGIPSVALSMEDPEAWSKAAEGADYIIHCALDFGGSKDNQLERNRNVLQALTQEGVHSGAKRMVFFSTATVLGYNLPPGPVSEDLPYDFGCSEYATLKIALEKEAIAGMARLPMTILRPTRVYGPRCTVWTSGPVAEVKSGSVVLVDGGAGRCNLTYIDNVVAAVFACLASDKTRGEIFNISDEDSISWSAFYGGLAEALPGAPSLLSISKEDLARLPLPSVKHLGAAEKFFQAGKAGVRAGLGRFGSYYPELAKRGKQLLRRGRAPIRSSAAAPVAVDKALRIAAAWDRATRDNKIAMHTSQAEISSRKLKEYSDYREVVGWDEGIDLTRAWLRCANLV